MAEKKEKKEEQTKTYPQSEQTRQAQQAAQSHDGTRPGGYVSRYQQQLDAAMEKILNRESFSYDLNGDALYRRYKDQAIQNGRLAMLDTMGQAAALTGGYGSSYSQSVGQQAYQKSMDTLADTAARLRTQAREEYDRQGEQAQSHYRLLAQRESEEKSAYDAGVSAWQAENSRLWDRYDALRQQDYDAYRDAVADEQWLAEFEEAQRQFQQLLRRKYGW